MPKQTAICGAVQCDGKCAVGGAVCGIKNRSVRSSPKISYRAGHYSRVRLDQMVCTHHFYCIPLLNWTESAIQCVSRGIVSSSGMSSKNLSDVYHKTSVRKFPVIWHSRVDLVYVARAGGVHGGWRPKSADLVRKISDSTVRASSADPMTQKTGLTRVGRAGSKA